MIGSGSYWQCANQQLAIASSDGWPAAVMAGYDGGLVSQPQVVIAYT
jgi:hypothetical protein